MSRARDIKFANETFWFDRKRNNQPAQVAHLELLAVVENLDLDDLLEEGLNQGEVIGRLRETLDQGVIPPEILERQRIRREQAEIAPECVLCTLDGRTCEGSITRHHFVTRWLMLLLENYEAYARRDKCTIPACMGRHRDLHMRITGAEDKSIARYLTDEQRAFAHKMLTELQEQHPAVMNLIRGGYPEVSYEAQLVRDFDQSKFKVANLTSSEDSIQWLEEVASVTQLVRVNGS